MAQQPTGTWFGWLDWLENTGVATSVREGRWLYPAVETAHIVGFVILVGAAAMFDLRLIGFSKHVPVRDLQRHLLRWSQASVLVVVPAGLTLFSTAAVETWQNPAFRIKMILIALAAINAGIFHLWTSRRLDDWNINTPAPAAAKFSAIASLILWTSVITCGRLIAYV